MSAVVWRATKTSSDEHRHLSHTVPAALAVGVLAGVACLWVWTAVPVLWFVFSLSVRGLVALGMVVHVLGGALTPVGVLLAWPLRVRGARWRMVGAPVVMLTL